MLRAVQHTYHNCIIINANDGVYIANALLIQDLYIRSMLRLLLRVIALLECLAVILEGIDLVGKALLYPTHKISLYLLFIIEKLQCGISILCNDFCSNTYKYINMPS